MSTAEYVFGSIQSNTCGSRNRYDEVQSFMNQPSNEVTQAMISVASLNGTDTMQMMNRSFDSGLVQWFVKQSLLDRLASGSEVLYNPPKSPKWMKVDACGFNKTYSFA